MKIICTQENFLSGLNIVNHLASKNANLPILSNILLKAEEDGITLSTTNLEIGIKVKIRGRVEEQGSYTAPARLLTDYVSLLEKDKIEIEKEDDGLKIVQKKSNTLIKGMPADDYPLIPENEEENAIEVDNRKFKNALNQTLFAVSIDETRPEISGVLFIFSADDLIIASTDSYRLAEKKIDIKNGSEKRVIIPLKSLQELNRIINTEEKENVKIYLSENQVLFSFNNVKLTSRLIDGKYPDYKQIIPTEHKTEITVKKEDIIKGIKSASLFCKPGINDVKLTFLPDKGEVVVVSTNSGLGENITNIEAEIKGQETEVVFNYRYLLDGLNGLQSERVVIRINNQGSPGVFVPEKNDSYLYIVMPIRQ